MFRGRATGQTPQIVARFFRKDDAGGDVTLQTISAESLGSDAWHSVENTEALTDDADSADLYITSRNSESDAFDVAAVSLVVE